MTRDVDRHAPVAEASLPDHGQRSGPHRPDDPADGLGPPDHAAARPVPGDPGAPSPPQATNPCVVPRSAPRAARLGLAVREGRGHVDPPAPTPRPLRRPRRHRNATAAPGAAPGPAGARLRGGRAAPGTGQQQPRTRVVEGRASRDDPRHRGPGRRHAPTRRPGQHGRPRRRRLRVDAPGRPVHRGPGVRGSAAALVPGPPRRGPRSTRRLRRARAARRHGHLRGGRGRPPRPDPHARRRPAQLRRAGRRDRPGRCPGRRRVAGRCRRGRAQPLRPADVPALGRA